MMIVRVYVNGPNYMLFNNVVRVRFYNSKIHIEYLYNGERTGRTFTTDSVYNIEVYSTDLYESEVIY